MDTTYHSNIPVETLSLLDCDVRNFDFIHPIKKEPLHFEAPLPEDMRRLFGQETNTVPPLQRSPFG